MGTPKLVIPSRRTIPARSSGGRWTANGSRSPVTPTPGFGTTSGRSTSTSTRSARWSNVPSRPSVPSSPTRGFRRARSPSRSHSGNHRTRSLASLLTPLPEKSARRSGVGFKRLTPTTVALKTSSDRDPDECEAREHGHEARCPSARSPHRIRTGAITHHRDCGWPPEVLAEKVNATPETIREHCDHPELLRRMESRRNYLADLE